MILDVSELTDEELEAKLESLRSKAPERLTKAKKTKRTKEKTVSSDAIQAAMAKLLEKK